MTEIYLPFVALSIIGLLNLLVKEQDISGVFQNRHQRLISIVVFSLRWYLAFYMFDYGWSKLMNEQFTISQAILDKPLKDVDTFHLAWYLFGKSEVFNIVVGLFQILAGALLIVNRTAFIGALLLLPIIGQIFLVDVSFTMRAFGSALPVRLATMFLVDIFICFYYRSYFIFVRKSTSDNKGLMSGYSWWVYLVLPVIGFLLDFAFGFLTWPIRWLLNRFFL